MPVKQTPLPDGSLWIDLENPSREEIVQARDETGIQSNFMEICLDADHLPKWDKQEDLQILVVRYYNHAIDKNIAAIQELSSKLVFFQQGKSLITVHRPEVRFLNDIRSRDVSEQRIVTASGVLLQALLRCINTFEEPLKRLSEQIDFHEQHIFAKGGYTPDLQTLYFLKQKASICHKLLLLTTEPLNKMLNLHQDDVEASNVHDHHLQMLTVSAQVVDEVTTLMNVQMNLSAHKTNEVVKLLTIFSVFFLPLTFIVGLYGMNFKHMPELEQKWGYSAVWVVMVLVVVGIYQWFRKKRLL